MRLASRLGAAAYRGLFAPGVTVTRDVAFGSGDRGRLDVYRPRRPLAGAPVALFFYGGTWQEGDRGFYHFVGATLASRGIVTVTPDYRLYPEVCFPDFLRDCAAAVRFTRDNATAWGGDPGRLFLIGQSAGAYNAAMLGLDRRWLGAEGLDPATDLAGVVGLAGPYDFLPLRDETLKSIFGPEPLAQTQPIAHAGGEAPPMLLLVGDKDRAVRPGNSFRLAKAIRAAGGVAEAKAYPGVGHVGILTALLPPLRHRAPVLSDIVGFIGEQTAAVSRRVAA